ncbi:hypothetical protein GBAR_LOCUS22019 [Geodia barretti]|uniref:Uncharacterized protein n=1 Tax=Geodia barretti TaxID=519541 RepID=A0AA35X0F1_GEOBA|nr:hypothetical protein GBAR_LOCUS22019 [Geodia barretti]
MGAIGRNPEAAGAVTTNMILAIAFAEAFGYLFANCRCNPALRGVVTWQNWA